MAANGHVRTRIGPYIHSPAQLVAHDQRALVAAAVVAELIRTRRADLVVEHIGSTAVSGCAGKGVVDIMIAYPDGLLDEARETVDTLGFQRQTFGEPFGEERPMRVGTVTVGGATFRVHVHVVAESSPEAEALRSFRDRLRRDAAVRREYVALKRRLIEAGITESPGYARSKGDFIRAILAEEVPSQNLGRPASGSQTGSPSA